MATPIDPSSLGPDHVRRIVEISWPAQSETTAFRSSIRGVLTGISHDLDGTSATVVLGPRGMTTLTVSLDGDAHVAID